ncbi:MAG TPA: PepSY domain-containing protein, partial [Myxococcaceae bacterium]
MDIRRVTPQPAPSAPVTTSAASAGASTTPAAAPRPADSGFSAASAPAADRLGTSRSGPHVALPSMQSFVPPGRLTGPLELNSPDAREAINTSMNHLNVRLGETIRGDARDEFSVRSVERDSLGMTHVRLDRVHDGLKVFPEQVIAHLDCEGNVKSLTGQVQPIPSTLTAAPPALSADDAKAAALKTFGNPTDRQPTVEKVLTQAADGSYRVAYHVETTNLGLASGPARQNYLIDAQTGEVLKSWNQMGGFDQKQLEAARARQAQGGEKAQQAGCAGGTDGSGGVGEGEEPPPPLKEAAGAADPHAAIEDNATVTSKITIDGDDFKAG